MKTASLLLIPLMVLGMLTIQYNHAQEQVITSETLHQSRLELFPEESDFVGERFGIRGGNKFWLVYKHTFNQKQIDGQGIDHIQSALLKFSTDGMLLGALTPKISRFELKLLGIHPDLFKIFVDNKEVFSDQNNAYISPLESDKTNGKGSNYHVIIDMSPVDLILTPEIAHAIVSLKSNPDASSAAASPLIEATVIPTVNNPQTVEITLRYNGLEKLTLARFEIE